MNAEDYVQRPLFGGSISSSLPLRFQDVSSIREVPDHQEVFADPQRDESFIFELLDLKHEVGDNESAVWFLRDIASEQDVGDTVVNFSWANVVVYLFLILLPILKVLEHSGTVEASSLTDTDGPAIYSVAVGLMAIAKERQGKEARNVVRVYLANLRLKKVSTDVVITAYEPTLINPLSESARTVGAGPAVPAAQSGCLPVAEIFKLAIANFKIHDWSLFGSGV